MRCRGPFLRWGRGLLVGLAGATLAGAASAQLGASLAADSDYRYRGVSLSNSEPSLRATLNYDAAEPWYAGASLTRAALLSRERYAQLLGYAGGSVPVGDRLSLELGLDASHFAGISGYDFVEGYVGVLADRWSARLYYAPDYYGRHVPVAYAELNAHVPLDEHARLFAHTGALAPLRREPGDAGRTRCDGSLGAGLVWNGWDLHLAWVAATRGGPYPAVASSGRGGALVVGASISF